MNPVLCASNDFFIVSFFMSSDKSDSLNDESDKLGCDFQYSVMYYFRAFLCLLTITVLLSWGLKFSHQQESIPKVVGSLHYFSAQTPDFPSKLQNQFNSYSLTFQSQRLQTL